MTDLIEGEQVFVARIDAAGRGAVHAGVITLINGGQCRVKFNAGTFIWAASNLFKSYGDAYAAAVVLVRKGDKG